MMWIRDNVGECEIYNWWEKTSARSTRDSCARKLMIPPSFITSPNVRNRLAPCLQPHPVASANDYNVPSTVCTQSSAPRSLKMNPPPDFLQPLKPRILRLSPQGSRRLACDLTPTQPRAPHSLLQPSMPAAHKGTGSISSKLSNTSSLLSSGHRKSGASPPVIPERVLSRSNTRPWLAPTLVVTARQQAKVMAGRAHGTHDIRSASASRLSHTALPMSGPGFAMYRRLDIQLPQVRIECRLHARSASFQRVVMHAGCTAAKLAVIRHPRA